MTAELLPQRDNVSSFIQKLDPETRDLVEWAIVQRTPPTLTACYEAFELAGKGLSFSAFYRYARRLRDSARLNHIADLTARDAGQTEKSVSVMVAQQLIDTLMSDDPSPDVILRLANAYRLTAQVPLAREKFEFRRSQTQETQSKLIQKRGELMADAMAYREKLIRDEAATAAKADLNEPVVAPSMTGDRLLITKEAGHVTQPANSMDTHGRDESRVMPEASATDFKKSLMDRIDQNFDAVFEARRTRHLPTSGP